MCQHHRMITDPDVPPVTLEEEDETENYTAIGFWNDSDEVVIVGIVRGVHQVFGGESCTDGGPWASSFHAANDDQAEYMADQEAEVYTDETRNSTDD